LYPRENKPETSHVPHPAYCLSPEEQEKYTKTQEKYKEQIDKFSTINKQTIPSIDDVLAGISDDEGNRDDEEVSVEVNEGEEDTFLEQLDNNFESCNVNDTLNNPSKSQPEQVTNEQAINGQVTNEQAINEQVTNEQVTNEQVTTEQVTNEQVTTEQVTNEQAINRQVTTEQVTNEQAINEQVTNEQVENKDVNFILIDNDVSEKLDKLVNTLNNS